MSPKTLFWGDITNGPIDNILFGIFQRTIWLINLNTINLMEERKLPIKDRVFISDFPMGGKRGVIGQQGGGGGQ